MFLNLWHFCYLLWLFIIWRQQRKNMLNYRSLTKPCSCSVQSLMAIGLWPKPVQPSRLRRDPKPSRPRLTKMGLETPSLLTVQTACWNCDWLRICWVKKTRITSKTSCKYSIKEPTWVRRKLHLFCMNRNYSHF